MSLKLNGEPLSASECKEGRACLRSWAGEYATDEWPEEDPDYGNEAVGHALHEMSKNYLDIGALPQCSLYMTIRGRQLSNGNTQKDRTIDVAALFLEGYQYLPPRGPEVTSELQLSATINGLPWTWTPDAIRPVGDDIEITDNKTSSDPKKHGLWTLGKWLDDVQAMTYGKAAILAMRAAGRNPQKVRFRWIYYWTKGVGKADWKPKAELSEITLTVAEVEAAYERVVQPIASKLYQLRSKGKIDPLTLKANAAHCQAFFRNCRFLGKRCNPDKQDVMLATLAGFGKKEDMTQPANIFGNLPSINGPAAPAPAALPANGTPAAGFSFGATVPAAQPAAPVPQSTQQTGFSFGQQAPAQLPANATPAPAPAAPVQPAPQAFGNFNPAPAAPPPQPAAPAPAAPELNTTLFANMLDAIAVGFKFAAEAMRRG